jgi:AcrR family transcriptional regulator
MRLFAEQGYERTSIADIHAAAGLTPGSGALYKHFPSKEAVLQAGMEEFIAASVNARHVLRELPAAVSEVLPLICRQALGQLASEHDELRIAWRELEHFPDMQSRVRRQVVQASYRALASWLEQRIGDGELREHDTAAVAAVLVGGLAMFRVFEALWGEKAMPISDERFVRAWSELATRALASDTTPRKRRSTS